MSAASPILSPAPPVEGGETRFWEDKLPKWEESGRITPRRKLLMFKRLGAYDQEWELVSVCTHMRVWARAREQYVSKPEISSQSSHEGKTSKIGLSNQCVRAGSIIRSSSQVLPILEPSSQIKQSLRLATTAGETVPLGYSFEVMPHGRRVRNCRADFSCPPRASAVARMLRTLLTVGLSVARRRLEFSLSPVALVLSIEGAAAQ